MDQAATIDAITRWADSDDNIRAVVVTGSTARGDNDWLSDVDVELYLRDPSVLLNSREWYAAFGSEVLAVEELRNDGWLPTRLLYVVDGKIDFAIGDLGSLGRRPYERPFRVLVDKDERGDVLHELPDHEQSPAPSAAQYEECVNWFAAAALMQARLIVRHEPWLAKHRDWDLKGQLLRMLVWDHRSRQGWGYETWYGGKHVNDWADADVRDDLDGCWAGFAEKDAAVALRASMALFQRVADRTATALGYPRFHHDRVRAEVDRILALGEQN